MRRFDTKPATKRNTKRRIQSPEPLPYRWHGSSLPHSAKHHGAHLDDGLAFAGGEPWQQPEYWHDFQLTRSHRSNRRIDVKIDVDARHYAMFSNIFLSLMLSVEKHY